VLDNHLKPPTLKSKFAKDGMDAATLIVGVPLLSTAVLPSLAEMGAMKNIHSWKNFTVGHAKAMGTLTNDVARKLYSGIDKTLLKELGDRISIGTDLMAMERNAQLFGMGKGKAASLFYTVTLNQKLPPYSTL